MNIGKCKNRPQYICDKCKQEIEGYHKNSKRHKTPNKYFKADKYGQAKRDFDLCDRCEERFRNWLGTEEPLSVQEVLGMFKKCKEDIWRRKKKY